MPIDVAEDRPVAVPAEAGAFAIADQQGVLERVRREAGEGGGAGADRQQPVRDRLGLGQAGAVEAVGPAERHGLALAEEALELERLEGEASEPPASRAPPPASRKSGT